MVKICKVLKNAKKKKKTGEKKSKKRLSLNGGIFKEIKSLDVLETIIVSPFQTFSVTKSVYVGDITHTTKVFLSF